MNLDATASQIVEELLASTTGSMRAVVMASEAEMATARPLETAAAPPLRVPAQSPVVINSADKVASSGFSGQLPPIVAASEPTAAQAAQAAAAQAAQDAQAAAEQAAPLSQVAAQAAQDAQAAKAAQVAQAAQAASDQGASADPWEPKAQNDAEASAERPAVDAPSTTNPDAALIDAKQQATGSSTRPINRQVPGSAPVIYFEGLTKIYSAQPNKPALSNISMSITAGEFIFLVGHSGSGKSTFIRLINREIVASRGKLMVAGEDVIRMRSWRVPYLRRNIGCVYQDFKLLPTKTAFENVAFALQVIGKSKHIIRTQVPEVLRLVGLEDKLDKYPDQLSGGEQQRVSIARAIVNRPPLLICDEPTGNLDPQTSLGIMRLLDRINRTGTTILVATHDREMVDSLRKRVIELENGYLVRDQDRGVYGNDA